MKSDDKRSIAMQKTRKETQFEPRRERSAIISLYLKGTSIQLSLTGIGWARNIITISFMHFYATANEMQFNECCCYYSMNRRKKERWKKIVLSSREFNNSDVSGRERERDWNTCRMKKYASIYDLNTSFISIVFPSVTYNLQPFKLF